MTRFFLYNNTHCLITCTQNNLSNINDKVFIASNQGIIIYDVIFDNITFKQLGYKNRFPIIKFPVIVTMDNM